MRCLFVTHRWGDAAPNTGESVTIPVLIETFREWGKGEGRVIWTDEAFYGGKPLPDLIRAAQAEFQPAITVYTPIPATIWEPMNAPPDIMRSGVGKAVTIYFDLMDPLARAVGEKYAAASDLCVSIDGDTRPLGPRFLSLWTPYVQRPLRAKTIDVSFVGARRDYPDRLAALERLTAAGIRVLVAGGRSEQRLSFADYFEIMDRSRIALNFSKRPLGQSQIKGRIFEALAAHCCLVEDENDVTARYLTPGSDYVAWRTIDELIEKIRWLLAEPDRAAAIARTGQATFTARYSAAKFWEEIQAALNP